LLRFSTICLVNRADVSDAFAFAVDDFGDAAGVLFGDGGDLAKAVALGAQQFDFGGLFLGDRLAVVFDLEGGLFAAEPAQRGPDGTVDESEVVAFEGFFQTGASEGDVAAHGRLTCRREVGAHDRTVHLADRAFPSA
jgi:hypothetical protein